MSEQETKPSVKPDKPDKPDKPRHWQSLLSYLQSALAAFAGIQSESKRQQDFAEDNLGRIIAIAFGSLIIFAIVVSVMVSIALP